MSRKRDMALLQPHLDRIRVLEETIASYREELSEVYEDKDRLSVLLDTEKKNKTFLWQCIDSANWSIDAIQKTVENGTYDERILKRVLRNVSVVLKTGLERR